MTNSSPLDHTAPLFHRLKLLKLQDIYRFHLLVHMYKAIKAGKFPIEHSINTRFSNLAAPKYHRLSKTQKAVSYVGPTMWNTLSPEIKNSSSISVFKKKLKSHILNQYLTQ